MKQRSDEWFRAHEGVITASLFRRALSGKPSVVTNLLKDCRRGLRPFESPETEHGLRTEPDANLAFQLATGIETLEVGLEFIKPEYLPAGSEHLARFIGASPDFITADKQALGEIKCPFSERSNEYNLKYGCRKHVAQIQGAMWVWGKQLCHFISYRAGADERTLMIEVPRDDDYINFTLAPAVLSVAQHLHDNTNPAMEAA